MGVVHTPRVRSGNIMVMYLDSKILGTIRSARFQDDYAPDPLVGIGDIEVQEYVPTVARHSITVEYAVMQNETMWSLGLTPENAADRLRGEEITIEVHDKAGSGVRKYEKCSFASGSFSVQANQIVMSDATFNARTVSGKGGSGGATA